jgi:hypothetical protein
LGAGSREAARQPEGGSPLKKVEKGGTKRMGPHVARISKKSPSKKPRC